MTAQNYVLFNIANVKNAVTDLEKDGIQELEAEKFEDVDMTKKTNEITQVFFGKDLAADVESAEIDRDYDVIVVYNAFPHFQDGERLVKCLAGHLKEGGKLTIAHGASRERIDAHHCGAACKVSNGLMEADMLSDIFSKYLKVTTVISDSEMYQVVGEK